MKNYTAIKGKPTKVDGKSIWNWNYYSNFACGICIYEDGSIEFYDYNTFKFSKEQFYNELKELTKIYTKETMVIWTFDIEKVWYALYDYIDKAFANKILYMLPYENEKDHYKVEIRALNSFIDNCENARNELHLNKIVNEAFVAGNYAQMLYDTMFIPEKKWWLTPYQRSKKLIEKASDGSVAFDWPSWSDYKHLRYDCYRGGNCFIHYPGLRMQELYIYLDRTSAYPAELMLNRYPMGKWKFADETKWYEYHDVAFYGHFDIEFEANMKHFYKLQVYKLDSVEGKASLWLTDIDIVILQKYLDIKKINCDYLKICEKDFLPKYFVDHICKAYIEKVEAKRKYGSDSYQVRKAKLGVNPIYGNLIINTDSYEEYCKLPRSTRPEWGIWCTAYQRLAQLELAEQVEDAIYGDTDSIFAKYTDKTMAALFAYNHKIDTQLKLLCDKMSYDYELLKELGTFKEECIIKDFIAHKTKQYGYIDENGNEHIKCSGYKDGSVDYEHLVANKLPKIEVEFTYASKDGIKTKKISYIEAKLYSELAEKSI